MEKVFEIMINCALEKRGGIFDYNEPVSIENINYMFDDNILKSAFGSRNVGLPNLGLHENYN